MINLPVDRNVPNDIEEQLLNNEYDSVVLSVYWPDDWKRITLTKKQVLKVLKGGKLKVRGDGYGYDGASYTDYWYFVGKDLEVIYKGYRTDEEGQGWVGTIFGVDEIEFVSKSDA